MSARSHVQESGKSRRLKQLGCSGHLLSAIDPSFYEVNVSAFWLEKTSTMANFTISFHSRRERPGTTVANRKAMDTRGITLQFRRFNEAALSEQCELSVLDERLIK